MGRKRLAFVVQRYGPEIVGGSESLCRIIAEMLASDYEVEVLTSCAKDYLSWKNEFPAGASISNGVMVRRFPADFERGRAAHEMMGRVIGGLTLDAYHGHKQLMRAAMLRSSRMEQETCLKLQGPYCSGLFEHLGAHAAYYDLAVFFTYLYPTTYFGAQCVPAAKTVLVPTAHDEAPIFMPVFRDLFSRFPAFVFLTPEERDFIETNFAVERALKATLGMPVQMDAAPDAARFKAKYSIHKPFLLYAGRIDPSKGCDALFRLFVTARKQLPPNLQLILIGNQNMDIPRHPDIHYLGSLPDQDKNDAMAAASVFVNPSSFESFSIVILEAMLCGTPVLVNGQCEVLKGHARRSHAGLYYETPYEFVEALRCLLEDSTLRSRMGQNGHEYVEQNYAGVVVSRRYAAVLARLLANAPHTTDPISN